MRRWILISALILLAVLGAAWWFLPSLVQLVALHYAPDLGLRGVVLDLEKIGTNQARAKRLQLTMDTSNGPVTVKLNDVTARYDLVGLNIEELHAASGQAIWRQEFTTAADDAPIVLPPLPPGRLRVDHLQVSLLTPLASLAVPGRLEVRTDPRQGITMTLQGDSEKITVKLPSDAASLELQAADLSGLSMLAADISDPLGNHTKVDLRTDLVRLHAWLPRRLQTDRIVLDHISAASLHSGHINMQIVYDPKARNWTLPDIRIAWESLNALDILTTTKIHAAALPDKDGWLLRVLDTSPFTLSGPGLPVREAQLELAPGASISVTASPELSIPRLTASTLPGDSGCPRPVS